MIPPLFGKQEVWIWRIKKRFPRYGVPIWSLWPNIRFLPSIVAKKNATKNEHTVHSKCINDHTLRSDIFLPKCPTNLRVNTLQVQLFGRTFWSDVRVDIKRFFFTFLEVNMSNILWSMRICKRTFFPVCRMCGYVNTLVYFYLAPYSRQER